VKGRRTAALAAALTGTAALIAVPAWTGASRDHHPGHGHERARNVIVLQGDGMATAQRDLIRLVTVGNEAGEDLAMNKLAHAGLVHTDPADPDEAVTDSAAAATAFSTGVKTFNGAVGVDVDGNPVPTLLEDARRAGKATGLVTTSQVTDATPAAYASHVSDRGEQSEIARQYLVRSKPDVILGGGEDWWLPAGSPGAFPDTDDEGSKGTKGDLEDRLEDFIRTSGTCGILIDEAQRLVDFGTVRAGQVILDWLKDRHLNTRVVFVLIGLGRLRDVFNDPQIERPL